MKALSLISKNFNKVQLNYIGVQAIGQFSLLLFSPFLTRIYTPSELAISSLFYTISSILGSISTISLENSILIEKEESNILNASFLSIIVSFLFAFLIIIVPFKNSLLTKFDKLIFDIDFFIFYLPIAIFLIGTYNTFRLFIVRKAYYKFLSISKICLSFFVPLISLIVGIKGAGYKGIIGIYILGLIVINIFFIISLLKTNTFKLVFFNLNDIFKIFIKNSSLIKWTTPSNLISNFSASLPVFLIGYLYGGELLGQYELAYRAFYFPVGIISTSIKDIYREKITKEINIFGNCKKTYKVFFEILFKLSIFILVPSLIAFPYLFRFIFGQQWIEGGFLIQSMFLILCINFISSPLSYVLIIAKKQRLDFIWQICFLISIFCSFLIPYYLIDDIPLKTLLFIYSFFSFIMYLFALKFSENASRRII